MNEEYSPRTKLLIITGCSLGSWAFLLAVLPFLLIVLATAGLAIVICGAALQGSIQRRREERADALIRHIAGHDLRMSTRCIVSDFDRRHIR